MDTKNSRIAALDGVRCFSMLIIMGFHFWQQSWLQNIFPDNLLRPLGVKHFNLTWIPRTGYMFVDVLLLLSGFCLFLPYARQMADPLAPEPDPPGVYFRKRAVRILPCYYLVLLVYLIFWIRPANYGSFGAYLQDVLAHFTLTQVFWPQTYLGTRFATVLWTLSVEVQFYLIFPLLARVFRRFPLQTWTVLCLAAQGYIAFRARLPEGGADAARINQLPAMLAVYANGMLAAVLCCYLRQKKTSRRGQWCAAGGCIAVYIALVCMLRDGLNAAAQIQRWQIDYRFWFSALIAVLILLLDNAPRAVQFPFTNRLVLFVSGISFNLYLWHHTVMLKLKEWHIPPYPDGGPNAFAWPQSAGSEPWHGLWQWRYAAVFWGVTFLLALLLTYGFEKPISRFFLRRKKES